MSKPLTHAQKRRIINLHNCHLKTPAQITRIMNIGEQVVNKVLTAHFKQRQIG